jgi:hypothetical protein
VRHRPSLIVDDMTVPKIMRVHSLDETAYVLKLEVRPKSMSKISSINSSHGKLSSFVHPSNVQYKPNKVWPKVEGEEKSNDDSKSSDSATLAKFDRMRKLPTSARKTHGDHHSIWESVLENQSMFVLENGELPQQWKLVDVKSTAQSENIAHANSSYE